MSLWHSFLDVSQYLIRESSSVSDPDVSNSMLRSALSRAYYSVFQTSKNIFKKDSTIGRISNASTDHTDIPTMLNKHANKDYNKVGTALKRLKDKRQLSDYSNKFVPTLQDTNLMVATAKQTLNLIDSIVT